MKFSLLALSLAASVLLVCLTFATVHAADSSPVQLPDQFYVSTGTTIPFTTMEPVTQSGAMYVDAPRRKMRVDTFWQDQSRSIIVDGEAGHCFVLESKNGGTCRVLDMRFPRNTPFFHSIPSHFIPDAESFRVRGVPVRLYSGAEQAEYLQEVNFYVRNMSVASDVVDDDHLDGNVRTIVTEVPILWRIETRRSHRREIVPPTPDNIPNWRFFGQPLNELVPLEEPHSTALETLDTDVPVTVDFFNFVPKAPDHNVFVMPSHCHKAPPRFNDDGSETSAMHHDARAFSPQRVLIDLSFHSVAMDALQKGRTTPQGKQPSPQDDL